MMQKIGRTLMVLGMLAVVASQGGCHRYRDLVDTCYPERYRYMAHKEVNEAYAPQVRNGHVLDQTIRSHHFEKGTAKLTRSGQLRLEYLARRRPQPDTQLFLEAASDVLYDPKKPEEYTEKRVKLNAERVKSIQAFLGAHTYGRGLSFNVIVHNPPEVGQAAVPVDTSIRQLYGSSRATLLGGGGGAAVLPVSGGTGAVR